jgi:hypothetical protein
VKVSSASARSWRNHVYALAIYAACTALVFRHSLTDPFHLTPGGPGDASQIMWFMRWLPFAVAHGRNPLVTTWGLYPQGANLMWNCSIIFASAVLSPLTLTAGPVFAYNALLNLAFALSGWAAYFAIRRMTGSWLGALVGGAMYAFSPFMLAHGLGHAQLFIAIEPPLVMLLLHELATGSGSIRGPGLALGVVAAAQLLTGEELLAITGLAGVLGLLTIAILRPREARERAPRVAAGIAWSLLVFIPLALVPLAVQFRGPQRPIGLLHRDIADYSNDLLNLVVPTLLQQLNPAPLQAIAGKFSGNTAEQTGYLGVPLLLLLAGALLRLRRDTMAGWAALVALLFLVLSLGPHIHVAGRIGTTPLPWLLFQGVPLLGNTLTSRLTVVTYLLSGVVVSWAVGRARAGPGPGRLLLPGLVALSVVTLAPTLDYPTGQQIVPPFFTRGGEVSRVTPGDVVVIVPFIDESPQTMLWQAVADFRYRMPSGYLFIPGPQYPILFAPPSPARDALNRAENGSDLYPLNPGTRAALADDLARWHARHIVVGPMANQDRTLTFITRMMRRSPLSEDGVYVWWDVKPSEVR